MVANIYAQTQPCDFVLKLSHLKIGSANSIEPGQNHGCAGWPGSVLVAKANHFWSQYG